jgi:hypothetical protein
MGSAMKLAVVFTIPAALAEDHVWRWRAADYSAESEHSFASYEECVTDAELHDFPVDPHRIEAHAASPGVPRNRS